MRSLTLKLTLAFLLTGLVSVALVAVFARYQTSAAFDNFLREGALVDFAAAAADYYERYGSWAGIDEAIQGRVPLEPATTAAGRPAQPPPGGPPPFVLVDARGVAITRAGPYHPGDIVPAEVIARGTAVESGGERVGTVAMVSGDFALDPRERDYLKRTDRTLIYAAIGGAVVALLSGLVLTSLLLRPIRALTHAIHAMRQGEIRQEVPVTSRDEIGELVQTFNQMSADLAQANTARRQMTADIAHELRTPLSVLTGYIEAMRDGVLAPSQARFQTMFEEASQLQHLIEDLRLLSLADAGVLKLQRQPVAPGQLLEAVTASFTPQAQKQHIALRARSNGDVPEIPIDRERIVQVLGNVVSNALRHTPEGGTIVLSASRAGGAVLIEVVDSGEGITADALPHIFERLYRADASRQVDTGGSGLGLAIAKAIVEAHGGQIGAQSQPGAGTTITIRLPAAG